MASALLAEGPPRHIAECTGASAQDCRPQLWHVDAVSEGVQQGNRTPLTMAETLKIARQHSPEAMRTLVTNLHHPDARVSTMSANLILERAWGKPSEQSAEQQSQTAIDLTRLSKAELDVLFRLAQSGRLTEEQSGPPAEIDGSAK
jgi:hypothetical protein